MIRGRWVACEYRTHVSVADRRRISSAFCGASRVNGAHCAWKPATRASVVTRIELFDQLKLRVSRKEASVLPSFVSACSMKDRLEVTDVTSQALVNQSSTLFKEVCINPKALSAEAAEFMLSVSASQSVISKEESEDASYADLILQGVHPTSFGTVLLVCTVTMFATPVEESDIEKARRRALIWKKAVGPLFSVLPVVAGYDLPPEISAISKDFGVLCFDNQVS